MNIRINQTELILLPERALYLPELKALCIADWHLGKAAHFRRSGIPVPQPDLDREFSLVERVSGRYDVTDILFLGDLFHSLKNNDWDRFAQFVGRFPGISFRLIKGNHDIIPEEFFAALGIGWSDRLLFDEKVIFTHEPLYQDTPPGFLNIAGHIHPGYRVYLKARQEVVLPCFHYSRSTLVLPAFGSLTGLQPQGRAAGDVFYCIVGDEVIVA